MSAQVWRVVDTRGVTREMTAELLIAATEHTSARWRFTHNSGEVTYDVDADDDTAPREALCRWAAFRITEIRGPGELTTAEQLAAVQASTDAAEARVAELCADDHARRHLAQVGERIEAIIAQYKHIIGPSPESTAACRAPRLSDLSDEALRKALNERTPGRWLLGDDGQLLVAAPDGTELARLNSSVYATDRETADGWLMTNGPMLAEELIATRARASAAEGEVQRLLREKHKCPLCHGKGTTERGCTRCHDSTWDHECNDTTETCSRCKGEGVVEPRGHV